MTRTAGLLVEIFASETPGKVYITTANIGPEELTLEETLRTLRSAAGLVEAELDQRRRTDERA